MMMNSMERTRSKSHHHHHHQHNSTSRSQTPTNLSHHHRRLSGLILNDDRFENLFPLMTMIPTTRERDLRTTDDLNIMSNSLADERQHDYPIQTKYNRHEPMMMFNGEDEQGFGMFPTSDVGKAEYHKQQHHYHDGCQEIGIYGWRKKMIYLLVGLIILLVGFNMALAIWILSFLGFSPTGISGIDLLNNHITFKGSAIFRQLLFASEVISYQNDFLKFKTKNNNLTFRSIWEEDNSTKITKLKLTKNKIVLETDRFEIYDLKKNLLFALDSLTENTNSSVKYDSNSLTVKTNSLKVQDMTSLSLPVSLQTSMIENSINDQLVISAPQSHLLLRGPKSVAIESKLGQTSIITFDNLMLLSNGGKLTLESFSMVMRRLPHFGLKNRESISETEKNKNLIDVLIPKPEVYQVCICSNSGKLFLSKPDSVCLINSHRDCR